MITLCLLAIACRAAGAQPPNDPDSVFGGTGADAGVISPAFEAATLPSSPLSGEHRLSPSGESAHEASSRPEAFQVRSPAPSLSPSGDRPKTPISRTPHSDSASHAAPPSSPLWLLGLGAVGVVVLVMIAKRRGADPASSPLPAGVFEIVGRRRLTAASTVLLARFGDRLLLLSAAGDQLRTLAEINDPAQVAVLMAACTASRSSSAQRGARDADAPHHPANSSSPVRPRESGVPVAMKRVPGSGHELAAERPGARPIALDQPGRDSRIPGLLRTPSDV